MDPAPPPGPDEFRAAGLYDPAEPHAAMRLELLTLLADLGASVDDMLAYGPELPGLVTSLVLRPPERRLSLRELSERSGVSPHLVDRLWRAAGFADPGEARIAAADDGELLQLFQAATELFGEESVIQLTRVIGSAAARIAEATVSTFIVNVGAPALRDDPTGLELARANAATADMLPGLVDAFELFVRGHLAASTRPIDAFGDDPGLDARHLAVGFVDLVGSTALSRQLSFEEFGGVLTTFEQVVSQAVTDGGGKLVKLVGDGAMFVADDAASACRIARDAAQVFADHRIVPSVRVGVAMGQVLARDGDYFGPVVSLASRLCSEAPVDGAVVTDDIRAEAAGTGLLFETLGIRSLKGFDAPLELFSLDV